MSADAISRSDVEEVGYAIRDLAKLVQLIEVAAENVDPMDLRFAPGVHRAATILVARMNELADIINDMVEIQPADALAAA